MAVTIPTGDGWNVKESEGCSHCFALQLHRSFCFDLDGLTRLRISSDSSRSLRLHELAEPWDGELGVLLGLLDCRRSKKIKDRCSPPSGQLHLLCNHPDQLCFGHLLGGGLLCGGCAGLCRCRYNGLLRWCLRRCHGTSYAYWLVHQERFSGAFLAVVFFTTVFLVGTDALSFGGDI